MIKFQAAILEELNKPLALRTLELPDTLYVGQVLVRIKYSGICGAQLNEIAGIKGPDKYLPHLLGHEGGGEVLATGPGVKHVKVGDHVVVHWRKGAGIEALPPVYWCPELQKEVGSGWCSTFQEYSIVSENRLTSIPKSIPLDIAALMGCAVTTGLGVILNDLNVKPGQSVLVLGCGGVGLNIILGAKLVSAYPIAGMDKDYEKLSAAMMAGADKTIEAELVHLLVEKYDYVVDTTGIPEVITQGWNLVKTSGTMCLVAQVRHDKHVPLQTLPLQSGRVLIGSDGGGTVPATDIPRYLELYRQDRLQLNQLITHRWPLAQINTALDTIREGKVGRAVLEC